MPQAIIFDCFGVVYRDAFKEFLFNHAIQLDEFLWQSDFSQRELGFPRFYYELARKIDMREITDKEFYAILAKATHELDSPRFNGHFHFEDSNVPQTLLG